MAQVLPDSFSDTPREGWDPAAPLCSVQPISNGAIYRGSGIRPMFHPGGQSTVLRGALSMLHCGRCSSSRLLVTYLKCTAHIYSGDEYWDLEARCHDCSAFNWYTGHD